MTTLRECAEATYIAVMRTMTSNTGIDAIASALARAHAEGKAEGRREALEEAASQYDDPELADVKVNCLHVALRLRHLIPERR